jgi:hypothetical protein
MRRRDYSLDDVQRDLQETVRQFVDRECPPQVVRAAEPLAFDAQRWEKLARLGVVAMAVPERAGGDGAGIERSAAKGSFADEQLGLPRHDDGRQERRAALELHLVEAWYAVARVEVPDGGHGVGGAVVDRQHPATRPGTHLVPPLSRNGLRTCTVTRAPTRV